MTALYDAVVVGAGLSGLQAALDLQAAGRSVLILESRDRVGGKTWSVSRKDGKGIQEVGAAWLNDSNQSHVWSYCQKFNLTPVVQNTQGMVASEDANGNCHFFPFGGMPKFTETDVQNIAAVREKLESSVRTLKTIDMSERQDLDKVTLEQWCRSANAGVQALNTVRLWSRGILGQEPSDVSALAFLEIARGGFGIVNIRSDEKHGAQHLRLKEGTQSIAIGISNLLPEGSIRLRSPVRSIISKSSKINEVITHNGQVFTARKVVVSIPSPAYKNIDFEPPLPSQKQTYLISTRYGCFIKFICLFQTPFWRRKGACGLAQSFSGPINHCRDTSVDDQDNYALTCFLSATPGRTWAGWDKDKRQESVLRQLSSLFSVDYEVVRAEYLGSVTSAWMQDQWAGWGCPFAAPPPGTFQDDTADSSRYNVGGIYFVGTEMADIWRGYMEGALRSGKSGASQALKVLNSEDAKL